MGTACAWKLAERGLDVVVLEKSVPGAEASTAAAGILGAHAEAHGPGPMADLLLAGLERHAAWSDALAGATGIDVEFRKSGVLRLARDARGVKRLVGEASWMRAPKRRFEALGTKALARLEPALAKAAGGVHFPTDARVDPKRFFRAVHIAAQRAGVRFVTGAIVDRVLVENGRALGVAVEGGGDYASPSVIVAAGSWSTHVRGAALAKDAVIPARGQMLELAMSAPLIDRVVFGPNCYLVPRDDGRVLVGSTLEFVGYRREVTAEAVRDLLTAAIALVPGLASAALVASWSNFRPYSKDELPIIGRSSVSGLFLATGHYRNGILLAPITAEIVSALATGEKPPADPTPFEAARLES